MTIIYQIIEATPDSKAGDTLRGGVADLWRCKDHEVILAGPANTGKTYGGMHKLDALLWKYPGSQAAIVRKAFSYLHGSVCQTYEKVANMRAIQKYGGERTERYIYPNGSCIWLGGMDKPGKVLSSERDFIYVNQAEEMTEEDWETLLTRCDGRAGHSPYPQLMGDCNPSSARHWIRDRAKRGVLTLLQNTHKDNPILFDDAGVITPRGQRSLSILETLTGVRRKRLFEGEWATAEGAVYDGFSQFIHVKERDPREIRWWALAMDEGYTHPAVILLVGFDADGRQHIAKEFYERGKLQKDVVQVAVSFHTDHPVDLVAVDAAAAGLIADLVDAGLPAQAFKGRVLDGITRVQALLKVQDDGRPRLTVDPACVNTINEFESYVWKPGKDEPVKDNDHAMDSIRYLQNALPGPAEMVDDPFSNW